MSGESWAEYVKEKVKQEKSDSLRDEYIKLGEYWAALGVDVGFAIGVGRFALSAWCLAFPPPSEKARKDTEFLMESWIREGYERAGKG